MLILSSSLRSPKNAIIALMAFDYKKEYKKFYLPKNQPGIIDIPPMNYLAVRGQGDPNDETGDYKQALDLLYPVAFTLRMSARSNHKIPGFFEYVVPPLEGFWWQDNTHGMDYARKSDLRFISVIRLPDFVTREDFAWAVKEAAHKKQLDFSKVEFFPYHEGLSVQCMHIGSYDDEPTTVELMHKYAQENGYALDLSDSRHHHEIYLSDPRKCATAKLKTVIRHPIKGN